MHTTLFRPVGQKEFELIQQSNFKSFPPRLSHQPYFYPVLNKEYATQIAKDWNTKDPTSGNIGYVLRFEIDTFYLSQFDIKTVGSKTHQEYWIPAENLDEFNAHIKGVIHVDSCYTN